MAGSTSLFLPGVLFQSKARLPPRAQVSPDPL